MPPPQCKIYPLDKIELAELKKQIVELFKENKIHLSDSPYGAPIFFAKKKDGKLRLCFDYCALNKNMISNSYSLPCIEELLSWLKGAQNFSRLDLRDGYFHVPIAKEDIHKTAFSCRYGTFEYLVMPFGLMNAPSTFQRLINQVFFDLLDSCVVVYLDGILVFSHTKEDNKQDLNAVFKRLQKAQLYVKESKCALYFEKVDFLGHVVSADGVSVQTSKINAVRDWPAPTSIAELQFFLGLANYYCQFVKEFAKVTAPLTDILRGKKSFRFGAEQHAAFDALKLALTSAPVLKVYDPELPV